MGRSIYKQTQGTESNMTIVKQLLERTKKTSVFKSELEPLKHSSFCLGLTPYLSRQCWFIFLDTHPSQLGKKQKQKQQHNKTKQNNKNNKQKHAHKKQANKNNQMERKNPQSS